MTETMPNDFDTFDHEPLPPATLALETFFDGHVEAWGVFEDRFGAVRREFFVDIRGTVEDRTLTLVEDFFYSDGETEQRIWKITRDRDGRYHGVSADSLCEAVGMPDGNKLSWAYDFSLRLGGRKVKVRFSDLFLLQPGETLINRAEVSKWGIKLGEANIFFRRADAVVGSALPQDAEAPPDNMVVLAAQ